MTFGSTLLAREQLGTACSNCIESTAHDSILRCRSRLFIQKFAFDKSCNVHMGTQQPTLLPNLVHLPQSAAQLDLQQGGNNARSPEACEHSVRRLSIFPDLDEQEAEECAVRVEATLLGQTLHN